MPTIQLVSDQDEVIGCKNREGLDTSTDIFQTTSLWITNGRNEVLLAQRKLDKRIDPGKWAEAVGGTVECEDDYETTIIREAEEELGLKTFELKPGPKQFITTPCRYFVQWYIATIDESVGYFTPQEEEVEQIQWVPLDQLVSDLQKNSDEYIEVMTDIVKLFDK